MGRIDLVGGQEKFGSMRAALDYVANPKLHRRKSVCVGDVDDEQDALGAFDIRRSHGAKSLLPGRVPPNHLVDLVTMRRVLDFKVNPDGGDERLAKHLAGMSQQKARFPGARVTQQEHFQLPVIRSAHGLFLFSLKTSNISLF